MMTIAYATVGCRLNQAETESAVESFLDQGWKKVQFKEAADVYYINTCTVTGRADRSSRQLIHRARRTNPDAIVIAAGCFAKAAAEELSNDGEVDVILGIREKMDPLRFLPIEGKPAEPIIAVDSASKEDERAAVGTRVSGKTRAFLKVQDGCDYSCAYCAVTLVRGESRSVPYSDVRAALRRILKAGFEEVVFTGVDVTAWGHDLKNENRSFINLVALAAEESVPRIRISSVEPWEMTIERIEFLASTPQWCPHLHLSLQSGDPGVLRTMNRETDLEMLKKSMRRLLELRPDATLGADIIAGFPGEDERAFQNTLSFVNELPNHYLHVFPFSPRKGTVAAEISDQIQPEIISKRADVFREAGRKLKLKHHLDAIGKEVEILVESDGRTGFSKNYLRCRLKSNGVKPRTRISARVKDFDQDQGLLLAEESRIQC